MIYEDFDAFEILEKNDISFEFDYPDLKDTKIYTIEEITGKIKEFFQNEEFQNIWVEGEVSNFSMSTSGHVFFSLKQGKNYLLKAVIWKSNFQRLKQKFKDGDTIIVHGYLDLYAPAGEYKIIVDKVRKKGLGEFYQKFLELYEKLKKEGLFKEEFKKNIPDYPLKIGLITAETGAAVVDMVKVIKKRAPYVDIVIFPCQVQGEYASTSIAEAIKIANNFKDIDLLIVGRGGGSIEDLWPFNEEIVARAIFDSKIPIISAVGHEINITIADKIADLRAATPSHAAEIATSHEINKLKDLLKNRMESIIILTFKKLNSIIDKLNVELKIELMNKILLNRIDSAMFMVEGYIQEMEQNIDRRVDFFKNKIINLIEILNALSPENTLKRGYAIILKNSIPIMRKKNIKKDDELKIKFYDGEVDILVNDKNLE